MNVGDVCIRVAVPDDAEALLAIYAPYVRETAITFEWDVPDADEFAGRIASTLTRYPYLVALKPKGLVGYAYTGRFYGRRAYDWSAETSIYMRRECRGKGVGGRLYRALEAVSHSQRICNLNACIAYTDKPDEHLSDASVAFHEHMGYDYVGRFHRCGYKFGRWYDVMWMEKMIGHHIADPQPFIPFSQIDTGVLAKLGIGGPPKGAQP